MGVTLIRNQQGLRLAAWAVLSSFLCGLFTIAAAHEVRPAIANVEITGGQVVVDFEMALEGLLAGIDLSTVSDTNESPKSGDYDALRAEPGGELEKRLRDNWATLASSFVITADDRRLAPGLAQVYAPEVGDIDLPRDSRVRITADLADVGDVVVVGWNAELGPLILRHQGAGEDAFSGYLAPGALSPPLPRQGGAAEGAGATFLRYVILGVEHIVPKGLDHILFVLGLFFFALRMRPLLTQVTAFTLAHTVTLALASLEIVTIPAYVVEPLIAASIVYVAVENLRADRLSRWRTAVVFGFGLLHGLGFASVLGDIGLPQGQFLVSLIGFNIGVEIGQLSVIAAAFLLVGVWFGPRWFYQPWIARPASVAIGLVGAWWVIERVFLG